MTVCQQLQEAARSCCCGVVSCTDSCCYSRCGSPGSGGRARSPEGQNSSRMRCRVSGAEACGVQPTADTQKTHGHTNGARQGMHCTLGLLCHPHTPSLHVAHSRSGSRPGLRWCGRSSGWRAEVPPAAPRAGPGAALRTSWLCCCCAADLVLCPAVCCVARSKGAVQLGLVVSDQTQTRTCRLCRGLGFLEVVFDSRQLGTRGRSKEQGAQQGACAITSSLMCHVAGRSRFRHSLQALHTAPRVAPPHTPPT